MQAKDKNFIRRCTKMLKCIELKDSICSHCKKDLSESPWDAEFHHTDPATKESCISQLLDNHISIILKELDKCVLICCGCHKLAHYDIDRFNKYKDIAKSRMLELDEHKNKKVDEKRTYTLRKQGRTTSEIALMLNANERNIRRVLRRIEKKKQERLLDTRDEYLNNRRKITDNEIIECYEKNMSRKEICQLFNITYGGLAKRILRLKRIGILK